MKPLKPKKCKSCGNKFAPARPLQMVCSALCGYELAKKQKDASWKKEKKWKKENLMTHSDWLMKLQIVFNTYIRTRDRGKPCVSCGCDMYGKLGNASHFFSVGSHPNLRFNEDNVHASCIPCNKYKHGNLIEYARRLPERIGVERFEKLYKDSQTPLKLSIPEVKELIVNYREKTKALVKP